MGFLIELDDGAREAVTVQRAAMDDDDRIAF